METYPYDLTINGCRIKNQRVGWQHIGEETSVLTSMIKWYEVKVEDLQAYGIEVIHDIRIKIVDVNVTIGNIEYTLP